MAKRFYIEYEDNHVVCGSNKHHWCDSSTLKTAQAIARKIANEMPVNAVRVLDSLGDDGNGYAPIVFQIS